MDRTTLITDRLILRPVAPRDAEAIAALADNYKIAVMLARLPYPYTHRGRPRFHRLGAGTLEGRRQSSRSICKAD